MKLHLTPEDYLKFTETLSSYQRAITYACLVAKLYSIIGRKRLHAKAYTSLKLKYGLGAQLTCNVIAEAYRRVNRQEYTPNSITLDKNTCTLHGNSMRIYTIRGRIVADLESEVVGVVSKALITDAGDNTLLCKLQVVQDGTRTGRETTKPKIQER